MIKAEDIIDQSNFTELLRVSREALRADRRLAEEMSMLLQSEAWHQYVENVLGPRIQAHGDLMLQPSGGTDGMVRSEFLKGALYGLCLARDAPSVIIQIMKDAHEPSGDSDVA